MITDQVQAKLRHVEGLLALKDEELMAARREIQMRDLDLKNFGLLEQSLRQEIKQLIVGRI